MPSVSIDFILPSITIVEVSIRFWNQIAKNFVAADEIFLEESVIKNIQKQCLLVILQILKYIKSKSWKIIAEFTGQPSI